MPNKHTISQAKYDATNCRFFRMKFNLKTDADVINKLESVPSKQDYIRQLIRADIQKGSDNHEVQNQT